jgi:NADH-quinone oxidoreductase subunit C
MENKTIIDKLSASFSNVILLTEESYGMLSVTVERSAIFEVIRFLKEEKELQFGFLTSLCGIHYPEKELPLGIVYHMHNLHQNKRIRVKTFTPVNDPTVKSVTPLFAAANWMERETYDFYGIIFEGHPNLKRILNVDYMDYFPLRKEYPLEDSTREDKDDRFFGR